MEVDVSLFLITTIGAMFSSFMQPMIKYILEFVLKENSQNADIKAELKEAKEEMSRVSMVDEFARHARLQRKVIKLQDTLKLERRSLSSTRQKYKLIVSVLFSLTVAIVMIPIIYMYRGKPVVILPTSWLSPISSIVAWPSEEIGAVSVFCWSAVCNGVSRLVSKNFPS